MFSVKNVFAVLVLYKTTIEASACVAAINDALTNEATELDILIYDNSPLQQPYAATFKYQHLNIWYQHDPLNGGLSKAYNTGAELVKDKIDKKWLLLFDQDTSFRPDFFNKTGVAVKSHGDIKLFAPMLLEGDGLFSPGQYKRRRASRLDHIVPGVYDLRKIIPVNSGLLISKDAFFEAGKYNERVKLDFSDFQFIERFRKKHVSFCVSGAIGYQDFSDRETDVAKLNLRYSFFCQGAKNFEKENGIARLAYLLLVLRRAVSLANRTKSLVFFKTFFEYYWGNKVR